MSGRFQFVRSTTAMLAAALLFQGERVWDTDAKQLRLGDGSTPGGNALVPQVTPERYGAKGDNITDDTAAINAALAAAADVRLLYGKTYYCAGQINFQSDNQRISGKGTIRSGANIAIQATGLDGVEVRGVGLIASGTGGTAGIQLTNCTNAQVDHCRISNHRLYGVHINGNSSACSVEMNRFYNGAITPSFGIQGGTDIGIEENSTHCSAHGNLCKSGQGTGVQIRNFRNNVQHCDYHTVSGNTIIGTVDYGIILYRDGPYPPDLEANLSVYGCTVTGNVIKDVSGARPITPGGSDYYLGTGIYIQGAEHTAVSGNTITNSHSANLATDNLAPGAIGCANVGDIAITGNVCMGDTHAGIYLNDQNNLGGTTGGAVVIVGNTVNKCGARAIYVNSRSNVIIQGNSVDGSPTGISLDRGSSVTNTMQDVQVSNNRINGASVTAITINYFTGIHISNNQIRCTAGDGINIGNGADAHISGNRLKGYVRGVVIATTMTGIIKLVDNQIVGDGATSTNGAILNTPVYQDRNIISGHTAADVNGTGADGRTLADTATPDATAAQYAQVAPAAATNITTFTGGVIGQLLTIRANNGNATLVNGNFLLSGAVNFAMANGASITLRKISPTQWLEVGRKA